MEGGYNERFFFGFSKKNDRCGSVGGGGSIRESGFFGYWSLSGIALFICTLVAQREEMRKRRKKKK